MDPRVSTSVEVALEPVAAFEALFDAMAGALRGLGIRIEAGPGGRVSQGDAEVGRVIAWQASRAVLAWRAAPWDEGAAGELEIRAERIDGGARVTVDMRGWGGPIGGGADVAAWFASALVAPFLFATSPAGLGDWITDRGARKPWGAGSRATYADPLFHRPFFRAILAELDLTPDDHVLDVGCGGGAFLQDALASGCRGAGVDHSAEMARVAVDANLDAVRSGRLAVVQGSAGRLPFRDGLFTAATMVGVLGFVPDLAGALAEIRRVLRPGGRLMALNSDPADRGTPAAPEPFASRLRFYEPEEVVEIARHAGFAAAQVARRPVEEYAREVGVPEDFLFLFAEPGPGFLLATKS